MASIRFNYFVAWFWHKHIVSCGNNFIMASKAWQCVSWIKDYSSDDTFAAMTWHCGGTLATLCRPMNSNILSEGRQSAT